MTDNNEEYVTISGGDLAYVTADGNFGSDTMLLFRPTKLTEAQWQYLSNLPEYQRLVYITAILNKQPLNEWEPQD